MTTNDETQPRKYLRDFLYVDILRLRSMYAQVFESVTEDIIRERLSEELTGETSVVSEQKGISDSFLQRETEGTSSLRRAERGVLHDHMYNQLEKALGSAIATVTDNDTVDNASIFSNSPFIRVSGEMEIEDYDRVRQFISKFNEIGEAIAYSNLSNPATRQRKVELEALKKTSLQGDERKSIEQELRTLASLKERARYLGLQQEEDRRKSLELFIDMFSDQQYHVVIASHPNSEIRYRGVLDKSFLRAEPNLIRSLYGNQSSAIWTMVGSVTFIPTTFARWGSPDNPEMPQFVNEEAQLPSFVDALRKMHRSARAFEQAFIESAKDFEIVLSPLAIYREFPIG